MILQSPVVRDVVLLGGGHTHVIVIRKWAMNPIAGVRLTLVSRDALTPYSGMLPGLVAGHYTVEQSHIDLTRLCRWAGVRFIEDEASGIEPEKNEIEFEQRPSIGYDILSIDTGGAPRLDNVKGAAEHSVPVKPVHRFYEHWLQIESNATASEQGLDIGIVGAGAGGFEIMLAMQHKLAGTANGGKSQLHKFHWIIRDQVLSGYPDRVKDIALRVCEQRNIECHHGFNVTEVEAGQIRGANDEVLHLNEVLWCTEAMAPEWPAKSGLQCDKNGFIEVNDSLQSLSHCNVFAAGDVALQINHPRPRAGVFAVRQGPVLFNNLQRAVCNRRLRIYQPQKKFLTLLSKGGKTAIGNKGPLSVAGKWVWRWKDWIDLRFMHRFNRLPKMPDIQKRTLSREFAVELHGDSNADLMRCGGCGAKIPWDLVSKILSRQEIFHHPDQITGVSKFDDVAMIKPEAPVIAQSVDQIRSFLEDPWIFSRIATVHALSDLYAAAAMPQSAMLLASLPHMHSTVTSRDLEQILAGVVYELNQAGCELSGGHTSEAAELSLGMVVNGYMHQVGSDVTKQVDPGDKIIITKALGVGVIMAADMRARSTGQVVQGAIRSMLVSNALAAKILRQNNASCMTDITGFGLIGHLHGLLQRAGVGSELILEQVPLLDGAQDLSVMGFRSSLYSANLRFADFVIQSESVQQASAYPLLFDPQTSGGLIAAVPGENVQNCIDQLHAGGHQDATVVGTIIKPCDNQFPIQIFHDN